jgi:endonuclease/exonuclease/phosphatase family metal-dependent hydrolase
MARPDRPSATGIRRGRSTLHNAAAARSCVSKLQAPSTRAGPAGIAGDAWNEAGLSDEGVVTFNGFSPDTRVPDDEGYSGRNYRIDWILLRGAIKCVSATSDHRTDRGLLPSDHYPVIAQVEWDDADGDA